MTRKPVHFLIAEDDAEDRMLLAEAFSENRLSNLVHFVENGVDLMEYLQRKNKYSDMRTYPRPGIIILDLNMPKMDGREALKELKNNPDFKEIPVVVLTTSKTEEDVIRSYGLGVNSFITKPVSFDALVNVIRDLGRYWLEVVELPIHNERPF